MSSFRNLAIAAALTVAVGCGGNEERGAENAEGRGGANGIGSDARPATAERTDATSEANRGGGAVAALTEADRQFVQKASMSHQMEVDLGNLAEDKAQRADVKQLGEQLARDHDAANRELQQTLGHGESTLAAPNAGAGTMRDRDSAASNAPAGASAARGRDAQSGGDRDAQAGAAGGDLAQARQQAEQTKQKLEGLTGRQFDQVYLEEMAKHHQHDISEFEQAARSENPQVRAYAEKALPTLRQHLQRVQQLQQGRQGQPSTR